MNKRTTNLMQIRTVKTLIVGIDIAKKKHWARMLDGHIGIEVGSAFSFQNNTSGFSRLLARIDQAKEYIGAQQTLVAMEPSGIFWKSLATYLGKKGITVVIVNPYHVKNKKEFGDNSPTKNDRKDALIIATLAWEGYFSKCYIPSGIWAELRGLTQLRFQQKAKMNAAQNNLVAILDEYFPEHVQVFKDPLGKASLYILIHWPFPTDLNQLTLEELIREMKVAGLSRVGKKKFALLLSVAKESVGVADGLTAARLRLNHCLKEITFWQEQLTETESAMATTLDSTGLASYLLSIPGIGVVTAASFLGEVGDLNRFQNWCQIRKLAGYNLTENSSGEHEGRTKISKRGRPGLRKLLYQASLVLVGKNPHFKALYQYLKSRRENPLKGKQALVVIACKLLRVMFTLAKEKRVYDPNKVLGDYRQQQISQAA